MKKEELVALHSQRYEFLLDRAAINQQADIPKINNINTQTSMLELTAVSCIYFNIAIIIKQFRQNGWQCFRAAGS